MIIMAEQYRVLTSDSVTILVTTANDEETCIPLKKTYKKSLTVKELKGKLEMLTGGSSQTMKIKIFNDEDVEVGCLDNDDAMIGSYHIDDGTRLHVEDVFELRKSLNDESNAEKYLMPVEEYAKRPDTLRAYLLKNKLGKYNEEEMAKREAEKKREEEDMRQKEEEAVASIIINDRCEVSVPGQPTRRAEIMFVGETKFKPGLWVGVKYDEPLGRNDGSVDGVKYFECPPKYGGFVKPTHVKVGDFPVESYGLDDEL